MKKITFSAIIILILFSANLVKAQQRDSVETRNWFRRDIEGAAQFQFTYRQGDIGQLNGILNSNGIKSISEYNTWINASMSHTWHNWITEDGIGFTPVATSENNGLDAKYNQYQIYFRAGYNILNTPGIKLYPFAGVNFSAAVLNIEDNNGIQRTDNFSSEILNSTSSKTFYQPNFGIELGAGFDYLIPVKPKRMNCLTIERNIPIGIRAGYYINAYAGDWKVNSYSLQSGPTEKQSAIFVSFNIGLGYEIKKD
jgi:flagellar hook-associated protein FlgK